MWSISSIAIQYIDINWDGDIFNDVSDNFEMQIFCSNMQYTFSMLIDCLEIGLIPDSPYHIVAIVYGLYYMAYII